MSLPQVESGEDSKRAMDPPTVVYRHPYATMVTAVFLFSLLITVLYFFGLYPGIPKNRPQLDSFLTITVVLFVATAVSWITAIILKSDTL
ncbi:hypothetical protein [Haloarcula sp. 1CSR25-25]|uniref:hypothetical protein n=1 Tax=Haloarcula sp. 1CSR25-25 TaxID=2862545 RepID=UPI00289F7F19|nr:hypothetical protein [Haloarcula sp. 1CSR25-25]